MTISQQLTRLTVAAALAAALSACGTTPTAPDSSRLPALLAEANKAAASGNKEGAINLWKQVAVTYPTEKAPWSHIAQTRYEAGQYGDAIQAALEVLVRDPNDKLANSIIAISGLRLSTRALGDLSRQNNLSGSLKTESQDLAKLLRESLGETVLVPPAPSVSAARERERERERPARSTRKSSTAKSGGESSNANPFQALQ